MNRVKKILLSLAVAFAFVITLASCSKVSQSYADKINDAAEKKEYITYETAKEDIADECFDVLNNKVFTVLVAVKGYKNDITWAELDKKLDELDKDTKVSCLIVLVFAGKCTSALYVSGSGSEIEAKIEAALQSN